MNVPSSRIDERVMYESRDGFALGDVIALWAVLCTQKRKCYVVHTIIKSEKQIHTNNQPNASSEQRAQRMHKLISMESEKRHCSNSQSPYKWSICFVLMRLPRTFPSKLPLRNVFWCVSIEYISRYCVTWRHFSSSKSIRCKFKNAFEIINISNQFFDALRLIQSNTRFNAKTIDVMFCIL